MQKRTLNMKTMRTFSHWPALVAMVAAGILAGCSQTTKSPDVSDNLRQALDTADRKSTRLNSSHAYFSYAVFCLKQTAELQSRQNLVCRLLLERNDPRRTSSL